MFSSALAPLATAQAAPPAALHTRTGLLSPVAVIDPLHPPAVAAAPAQQNQTRPKGAQTLPARRAAARSAARPAAAAGQYAASPSAALTHNFNGVSSLDSAVTNFGFEFEPPDQGLCQGNGVVLEPVNSAYSFYNANGARIAGPINVNILFGDLPRDFTTDPRCFYDQATNRWFAIIAFLKYDNSQGRVEIAVSSAGDPTLPWTIYRLDATENGLNGTPLHPGCPCFGDQPLIGLDSQNLYISTNEFSITGPQFNGAQLYAISKSELIASATAHFVMYENLTIGGAPAASVQPALNYQAAPAEYFLSSLDPNGTGDNRLGVWALTNPQAVTLGGVPTLSSLVIQSDPYSIPPAAVQPGTTSLIDSGDDRMQQVEFINGEIWGALGTALVLPGHSFAGAGIAWFRVQPTLNGSKLGSALIVAQNYFSGGANALLYPAIQATSSGLAAMVFTVVGSSQFPSAAYAAMNSGHTAFGPIHIVAPGTGSYDPNAGRWGDYSFANLDSGGQGIWFATEYIPPAASQTTDGRRNWGTRVFEVTGTGS